MNQPTAEQLELLTVVRDDWLACGLSTQPADRVQTRRGSWEAYEAAGQELSPQLEIWVDSPLTGVLAAAHLGFALDGQLKPTMTASLQDALTLNVPAVHEVRRAVDKQVWHRVRKVVHDQVAAELAATGPELDRKKKETGNFAWDQVWQRVGDPMYDHYFGDDARRSDSLLDDNLRTWADDMMDGQLGAGALAALDGLELLGLVDATPVTGVRRVARSCCWWWAYDAGAIFCERPLRISESGGKTTVEFRDGWTACG